MNDDAGGRGGGGGTASASPAVLRRYADAAEAIDDALSTASSRLTTDREAWAGSSPEFGGSVAAGLAGRVSDAGNDASYTTGWVRLVAGRFEDADSGSGGVVTVADDARLASLIPPATESEAAEEGEAQARELRELLAENGLDDIDDFEGSGLPSEDELDDLVESYPELASLLEEIRANGVAPAYHDAFVGELGADGIEDTLAAIRRYGAGQYGLQSNEGSELAEANLSQDLLRPFDEVVRAGLDADANAGIDEELLDIDSRNAYEVQDLALLLAHGDGAPQFSARAAETVLRAENHMLLPLMGGPMNGLYVDDPYLMSGELLAIRALDRSPEASFDFLTRTDADGNYTDNASLLIRPPNEDYVELIDGYLDGESAVDEYHRRAGGALENGYSVYPETSGDPNDMFVANDAFEVAIHETGEGDVPDTIKRSLASIAVTSEKMEQIAIFGDDASASYQRQGDPLWENVDDDAIRDFFQELGYDNEGDGNSLEILSAGIGAYGRIELERGIAQATEGGEEFEYTQLDDEATRVGSLYGNFGAGLREINSDELSAEARRDAILGGLKTGANGISGVLITISPLTGGSSAVAGLTVKGLVDGAGYLGDRASEPDEISIDLFKEEARDEVYGTLTELIDANPEARALIDAEGGDTQGPLSTVFNNVDDQLIKKLDEAGE